MKNCRKTRRRDNFKNITAIVDTRALHANLNYLREKSGTDVMPVLKANAYGHGLVEIARLCRKFGANYIGVATVEEAMHLRDSGDRGRILAWMYDGLSDQVKLAVQKNIEVAIFDAQHIPIISESLTKRAKVHLFVDTGLNRSGVPYEDAFAAAQALLQNPKFHLVGVMSHLCCAGVNDRETKAQYARFRKLRTRLAAVGFQGMFHISATEGILKYDNSDFDMVRSGDGLFGIEESEDDHLTAVMTLESKIVQLKTVNKHRGVGYFQTYKTRRDERIAVIPAGYADFLPCVPHEKLSVFVNGSLRKVLGVESMDQIVVHANDSDKLGDKVVFFGDRKKGVPSAVAFAKMGGTFVLEILSHLGTRVRWLYV